MSHPVGAIWEVEFQGNDEIKNCESKCSPRSTPPISSGPIRSGAGNSFGLNSESEKVENIIIIILGIKMMVKVILSSLFR